MNKEDATTPDPPAPRGPRTQGIAGRSGRAGPGGGRDREGNGKAEGEAREEAPIRDGKSRSSRKKKKAMRFLRGVLIDVAIAFTIIIVILASLWAYTSNWPPVVVIESESMMHGDDSSVGIIDTGDLVMVKSVDSRYEVVTYLQGKVLNYRTYGDYGDVIIYRKNGLTEPTPVIHRAVMYLEYNSTGDGFDIPVLELLEFGRDRDWWVDSGVSTGLAPSVYNMRSTIILPAYGHTHTDVHIELASILNGMTDAGVTPHSGFITKGDNNNNRANPGASIDQANDGMTVEGFKVQPVRMDWVVGKAQGELPWFGLMKLLINKKVSGPNSEPGLQQGEAPRASYRNLWLSLAIIIAIPICADLALYARDRYRRKKGILPDEDEEDGEEGEEEGRDEGGGSPDEAGRIPAREGFRGPGRPGKPVEPGEPGRAGEPEETKSPAKKSWWGGKKEVEPPAEEEPPRSKGKTITVPPKPPRLPPQ